MSLKGTVRSIRATVRQAERESRKRQRELERQHHQLEKMQELEKAKYAVELYENQVDLLLSVHKECGPLWNWEELRSAEPPVKPTKSNSNQEVAQANLERFEPSFFDKVLGRTEDKQKELARAVEKAQEKDEQLYLEALEVFEADLADWEATCELAEKVLTSTAEGYSEAIRQVNPFSNIGELGTSIQFQVESSTYVEATLHANSEEVIPSETKSLLKSGKVSVNKMPKTKFYELYQDYVCGCALRVARELLSKIKKEH